MCCGHSTAGTSAAWPLGLDCIVPLHASSQHWHVWHRETLPHSQEHRRPRFPRVLLRDPPFGCRLRFLLFEGRAACKAISVALPAHAEQFDQCWPGRRRSRRRCSGVTLQPRRQSSLPRQGWKRRRRSSGEPGCSCMSAGQRRHSRPMTPLPRPLPQAAMAVARAMTSTVLPATSSSGDTARRRS